MYLQFIYRHGSGFVSIPKSCVLFFFFPPKRAAVCRACDRFGGFVTSGAESAVSRQNEGAGECSKPFAGEARWGRAGTCAHRRRRHASWWKPGGDVGDDSGANVIASRVSLPLFLTDRRLSLIGAPQSRDLMLYFSLSRRQLRSAPCFPFGLTLILCLYVRMCVATARRTAHSFRGAGETGASASSGAGVQRKLVQKRSKEKN